MTQTWKSSEEITDQQPVPASVTIMFKRSSTKDKGEGYEVRVTEDATPEDIECAFEQARRARRMCLEELGEMVAPVAQIDELLQRLEAQAKEGSND